MNFAARITGTGSAFPENCVTNEDLVEKVAPLGVETSDQWIVERTGIRERRISDLENPAESNSSLGAAATMKALAMAGKTDVLVGMEHSQFINVPIPVVIAEKKKMDVGGDLWRAVLQSTGQPRW